GKICIGTNVLGSHDAISAPVGFARDDGDFWDRGFGKRKEQLGAVLDDAAKFLLRARKKTGNILKRNQRNIESIAEAHEARTFHGSIDIEPASKKSGLVADDADRTPVEARKAHDKILRVMFVDFEEESIVDNR